MLRKIIIVAVLNFLALFIFTAGVSHADFNIKPLGSNLSYYQVKMKPGETKSFEFEVYNEGESATEGYVYASDQLTSINGGGASYTPFGKEPNLAGKWLSGEKSHLTLKPGEKKKLSYNLSVPKDVEPGQYIAVVVALGKNVSEINTTSQTDKGKVEISGPADLATGKQIVVEVDMDRAKYDVKIVDFTAYIENEHGTTYGIVSHNDGTILVKPSTTVTVRDSNGNEVISKQQLAGGESFYPGTDMMLTFQPNKKLPSGDYSAEVIMSYEGGRVVKRTFDFNVSNKETISSTSKRIVNSIIGDTVDSNSGLLFIIIIGLVVVILILLYIILFKKKKDKKKEHDPYFG